MRLGGRELELAVCPGSMLHCWRFPGRWLDDDGLARIRRELEEIARQRLPELPDYGVFRPGREEYRDRIVSICYEGKDRQPAGFSAMAWCPVECDGALYPVVHLGLVMLRRRARTPDLLLTVYFAPLLWLLMLRRLRPFWITSVSMEPSIIGAVADCFDGTYPHYRRARRPGTRAPALGRAFVVRYARTFGAGCGARLREPDFVIEGSCRDSSAALRVDYRQAARYPVHECNAFCRDRLDFRRGDELLQVGRCGPRTVLTAVRGWRRAHRGRRRR